MAWVKLDDAMPHHPKVMAAGPQAFALDVAGICYSNKHATDGFIADYALPAVLPSLSSTNRWAKKLVEVGRWYEVEGGYQIHDVADYQPTAAQQKEISKKRAEAGRRGGLRSSRATEKQVAKQVASGADNPDPTRPDPTPTSGARKRASQLPDGWRPDDVTNASLAKQYPQVDLKRELEQFRDHAKSKGRTAKDWTAAWRMWVRKADEWRQDRAGPNDATRGQPPAVGSPEWEAREREQQERAEALAGGSA